MTRLNVTNLTLPCLPKLAMAQLAKTGLDLPSLPYRDPCQPNGHSAPHYSHYFLQRLLIDLVDDRYQGRKFLQILISLAPCPKL